MEKGAVKTADICVTMKSSSELYDLLLMKVGFNGIDSLLLFNDLN